MVITGSEDRDHALDWMFYVGLEVVCWSSIAGGRWVHFFCSTRVGSILPSRPLDSAAVARRACQGWRIFAATRRAWP
jgi:hypothetical protein